MKPEFLKLCEQIVAAGANGVYQGLIIALLVGLGLRVCRRTNAATRHGVWFATLLLLVLLIPAHLVVAYLTPVIREGEKASAPPQASVSADSPQAEPGFPEFGEEHHLAELQSAPTELAGRQSVQIQADQVSQTAALDETPNSSLSDHSATDSPGADSIDPQGEAKPAHDPALWRSARFLKPLAWTVSTGASLPGRLGVLALAFLVCIAAVRIAFLGWRLVQLRRLKIAAVPASGELHELFQRLRQCTRTSRAVDLRVSETQRSPVLVGFVHPVVLLPQSAVTAAPVELEHILRHELAHLARRDDWANLAQHAVQAAFFFHPAVHWISRRLSLEREIACDDYVLEQGSRPRAYALILANLAGHIRGSSPLPAPGVSTSKSQLQERITMILNTRRNASPRLAKTRLGILTSAAVITACIALYTAPRIVFAQSRTVAGGAALAGSPASSSSEVPVALPGHLLTPGSVVVAANSSTDQGLPDVDHGPKAKSSSDADDALPVAAVPPMPNLSPVPAPPAAAIVSVTPAPPAPPIAVKVAPLAPVIAVSPRVTVAARPSYSPRLFAQASTEAAPKKLKGLPALKPDATLEERLERLEKMVESLVDRQNTQSKPPQAFTWKWEGPGAPGKLWDNQGLGESAKRQAEQANRAAGQEKRAAEASERAAKRDGAAAQEQKQQAEIIRKEAYKQQLEAVRKARESLKRELERLDRQLERLERDREHLDGQQGRIDIEEQQSEEESKAGETALLDLGR